jgi:hypothetical protein
MSKPVVRVAVPRFPTTTTLSPTQELHAILAATKRSDPAQVASTTGGAVPSSAQPHGCGDEEQSSGASFAVAVGVDAVVPLLHLLRIAMRIPIVAIAGVARKTRRHGVVRHERATARRVLVAIEIAILVGVIDSLPRWIGVVAVLVLETPRGIAGRHHAHALHIARRRPVVTIFIAQKSTQRASGPDHRSRRHRTHLSSPPIFTTLQPPSPNPVAIDVGLGVAMAV